jgi:2-phosphosulfolactate phosphatase
MQVDVVGTPDDLRPASVSRATVLVIDVLRASTTIVSALANGCAGVVPVVDAEEARRRRGGIQEPTLIAGERRGEPLAGFDLGNSPLEFTAERVAGRTIVFTTSNGTRALLAAREAPAVAVAALVNLGAAAAWALGQGRDVLVLCAGERGARSLEDWVCAGLLASRLVALAPGVELGPGAVEAARDAAAYDGEVSRLGQESRWARHLWALGRGADVAACLALDTTTLVPRYCPGVDKILAGLG